MVYNQPGSDQRGELELAHAAMEACPVAAIRVETKVHGYHHGRAMKDALTNQRNSFPRRMFPMKSLDEKTDPGIQVYYLGHHNNASFGAIPYLILGRSPEGNDISVMVDVPRFSPSAIRAVKSLTKSGPDYLFLTHVDDTADHNKWKNEFPSLKRIFHSGDLGRHNWIGDLTLEGVEILLEQKSGNRPDDELVAWDIDGNQLPVNKVDQLDDGEFLILHTPGHSPGSVSLLFRPKSNNSTVLADREVVKHPIGVLFTGDTYAWTTRDGGHMSGFPRYGHNLPLQATILEKLGKLSHTWDIVAPGHGHPRTYLDIDSEAGAGDERKLAELRDAIEELISW